MTAGYGDRAPSALRPRARRRDGVPRHARDRRAAARSDERRRSSVVPTRSRVFAVAGIARPGAVLRRRRGRPDGRSRAPSTFRDHHPFTDARRRAHRQAARAAAGADDRADDGEGRRAAGGLRCRRPADRGRAARRSTIEPGRRFRDWLFARIRARSRRRIPASHSAPAPGPGSPDETPSRIPGCAARSSLVCACCRRRSCERAGALLGLAVLRVRPRAPPDRASATSRPRFRSRSAAERRAIVRGAFAHFGRLLFELLKFSTLSPERDAGARRVRRRGARAPGLRAGQGRAVRHRPLRLLGAAGDGARAAASSRWACWRARSTTAR